VTRSVTGAVATALTQPSVGLVLFVEMMFDATPMRVCSAPYSIQWNSFTWTGLGNLGTVEEVREAEGGEVSGLAFTLTGVPTSMIATALGEKYQRRVVNVYVGFLNLPQHGLLADPVLEWSGLIDTMAVVDEARSGAATIRVTAENELYDFARPAPLFWTDEDQQRLYPGDTGLRFAKQLTDRQIVWPAADFFKR
jgi:hypothetical protein